MLTPDHDPVAADLAEDLPRRFGRPSPRPAVPDNTADLAAIDDEALEVELARWGLAGAFPPLKPPPDPRDLHALLGLWVIGALAVLTLSLPAIGAASRWWMGLPILR